MDSSSGQHLRSPGRRARTAPAHGTRRSGCWPRSPRSTTGQS